MFPQPIYDEIAALVGAENVSQTEADRAQHMRDASSFDGGRPDLVVWPENSKQVSQVVVIANREKMPIVGWGAGSGIEGNNVPIKGGIIVDFVRHMNRIVEIHENDFQVTVQPGIFYRDMNKLLSRHGIFFPPDPGANASVGGMIANNAAGSRTVKYGATRDNVLALEVVLASGEIVRTGSRSVKQSAGYDLTHLFTGSEGTLGLITEATLKLYPVAEHVSAVMCALPNVQAAADAVYGIIGSGLNPAALELVDAPTAKVLIEAEGFDIEQQPNLFMEFNGASETALKEELKLVEEICGECGSLRFEAGIGWDARNHLWEARHRLFETMVRYFGTEKWLVTDVAVPISNYPELVGYTADTVAELGLNGGLIGHAGDGNLHACIFYNVDDHAIKEKVDLLNEQMVTKALALGGTSTGEHGVGLGKKRFMEAEHGPALTLMKQIKAT
ncbi:MAG: FAD-binding oxidoreductase, partial [Chloroflexota bacterium]